MELKDFFTEYMKRTGQTLNRTPFDKLIAASDIFMRAREGGRWIFTAGNGGSSATASHFVNDFMKGLSLPGKKRFRVMSLNDCTPLLTAWSNDRCYEEAFYQQLINYADPEDVLAIYSGSGNSPNVVKAAEYAKSINMKVVAFTGGSGGSIDRYCDVNCVAPTDVMEEIEDAHMVWEHAIISGLRLLIESEPSEVTRRHVEWGIEVISDFTGRGGFKSALFDFDGTISLIRQGWQDIMKPYFFSLLKETPGAKDESDESLMNCVHEFVDVNTGKQTIYQCISLAEEIKKRSGKPEEPVIYKNEYQRRLLENVRHRIDGLESGKYSPEDFAVPGSLEFLESLHNRGLILYLASGTDEEYALNEARLLNVEKYFQGGVYGAKEDYKKFSKEMVVKKIISQNDLNGAELIGFGDGFVEIENVKAAGGFAVGVATNEKERSGVDEWKRNRLIQARADVIIPDFSRPGELIKYIFKE